MGRYVKGLVYTPPLPEYLLDLKNRIVAAVETTYANMPQRVWQELEYRINIRRATKRAHMERL